jgi:hypothetical protein
MTANRAHLAHIKIFRYNCRSRNTKLQLYRTLRRLILTYGSEAWTMTTEETNVLRIFERKVVMKIHGHIKDAER